MELLLYIIAGIVAFAVLMVAGLWLLWRRITREERRLIMRVTRLRLASKLRLVQRLIADPRMPLTVRVLLPLLVLYLALPIDIIPDFIPVIGLLDDVFLLVVGVHLLLRLVPRPLLETHVEELEAQDLDVRAAERSRS